MSDLSPQAAIRTAVFSSAFPAAPQAAPTAPTAPAPPRRAVGRAALAQRHHGCRSRTNRRRYPSGCVPRAHHARGSDPAIRQRRCHAGATCARHQIR
jgi:hypothetical protein